MIGARKGGGEEKELVRGGSMNKKIPCGGGGGEKFSLWGYFFYVGSLLSTWGPFFPCGGGSIELPPNNNFCWSLFRLARAPLESGIDYFWKL